MVFRVNFVPLRTSFNFLIKNCDIIGARMTRKCETKNFLDVSYSIFIVLLHLQSGNAWPTRNEIGVHCENVQLNVLQLTQRFMDSFRNPYLRRCRPLRLRREKVSWALSWEDLADFHANLGPTLVCLSWDLNNDTALIVIVLSIIFTSLHCYSLLL